MEQDTIFALSSGMSGYSPTAVAVIRISGPQSSLILQQLTNKKVPRPREAALRTLYDPIHKTPLDQALVLWFPQPRSFTGEDVVELHCHGSRAVVSGLLDTLAGFHQTRLAEPGEFTQRAFGKGKLDLLQVEALADLLASDTQRQRQQALQQLQGQSSKLYDSWRQRLVEGLAHAEAVIDFGDDEQLLADDDDYQGQWNVWGGVQEKIDLLCESMRLHLRDARRGELVREGIRIAIVGPPNAGKSSLFNVLAQQDVAIVSPIEGTTRDVLQVSLNLGGVKCTLSDTAGVRETTIDVIEKEGMKRAKQTANEADLVVAMVDAMDETSGMTTVADLLQPLDNGFSSESQQSGITPSKLILVVNKQDLKDDRIGDDATKLPEQKELLESVGGVFEISCVTLDGIEELLEALTKAVVAAVMTEDGSDVEGAIITRARHRQHVQEALEALERFQGLSQQGAMAVDMAAEELRLAASHLGRITGAVDVEDILDKLFSDFCIGK